MIKGNSVLGKPVLSRADGERLDTVKDVILNTDRTRVIALLLNEGNIFSKPTVVPIESVVSFGKDAVVISDKQAVVRADHVPAVAQALDVDQRLSGRKVFAETGDHYGKLADIYFDEKTGDLLGVDVTDVGEGNVAKKSAFLDKGDIISFGADALVISASGASGLVDTTSGSMVGNVDMGGGTEPPLPPLSPMEPPTVATTDAPAAVARVADDEPLEGRTDVLPPMAGDEGPGPQSMG